MLLALALVSSLSILSCGYTLVGKGDALPEHVKKTRIPVFQNLTLEAGIEALVTDAFVARVMNRGLEVTDDAPDAEIEGTVVSYSLKRLSYDKEGIPNEYRVEITAEIKMTDLVNDEVIFPARKFSVGKDYKVDEEVSDLYRQGLGEEEQNVQTREQARKRALEMASIDLAEKAISALLDAF